MKNDSSYESDDSDTKKPVGLMKMTPLNCQEHLIDQTKPKIYEKLAPDDSAKVLTKNLSLHTTCSQMVNEDCTTEINFSVKKHKSSTDKCDEQDCSSENEDSCEDDYLSGEHLMTTVRKKVIPKKMNGNSFNNPLCNLFNLNNTENDDRSSERLHDNFFST